MEDSFKSDIGHRSKILIIDDEADFCWLFSEMLDKSDYEVISARSGKSGLAKMRKHMPDLVFLDLKLPDKGGIEILKDIKKIESDVVVIMVTAYDTINTAVEAMRLGAYDYIPKPVPNERLKIIIDKALETQRLSREVKFLRKDIAAPFGEMVGQSEPMQKLFKLIERAASHEVSVILRGESGTGKELVARAIHASSGRKDKPFVPVDCATLPETLVESELFGYEKGAFTGAEALKIGRFEAANEGMIFLDEVGNLTPYIQVKLLRVLQERKIERLGGKKSVPIDVQIISATNRNLEEAVRKGGFRDDLYHRLNVLEIGIPPLKERGDDTTLLSQYFLGKFNRELDKSVGGFSDEVMSLFREYSWPGNVRELENTVKSAVILADEVILSAHLPDHITKAMGRKTKEDSVFLNLKRKLGNVSLKEAKRSVTEDAEKYMIKKVLNETKWNKRKAAEVLGIDYKSLFTKIKKYSIAQ